jgi:signal transduction histidine kinase
MMVNLVAGRRLSLLLPMAVLAAAAAFAINEVAYQDSSASLSNLEQRAAARTALNTVIRRMLDAESAQRGYLLTGRTEYLAPRDEVSTDLAAAFKVIESHYRGDARLLALAKDMHARTDEKLSELSAVMDLYNAGEHERWRDLMLTNIGREKMEAVRSAAEVLLAAESERVKMERQSILRTLSASRIGVHLLTLLALIALVFYARKTRALQVAQQNYAAALIVERDEFEGQVHSRTLELAELARHLQTAREDERSRLARELHDELGALLTAAKLDVARLKRGIGTMTPEIEQRVQHLNQSIDQGIALKRRIIEDLRPSSLSNLGLVAALRIQADEFAERSGLTVKPQLDEVAVPEPLQITVYRVVQEALTNVAKYAKAKVVSITTKSDGSDVVVSVKDDGQGFNVDARRIGSHGLLGMRYRVEAAGGTLRIVSAPGQGTLIEARLPSVANESGPSIRPIRPIEPVEPPP